MGPGRSVTVDTVFAAGTMVSEMLGALIPALPWADGASWNMPVFTPSEGTTGTVEITVAGTESVTVPAGTFEVYRVDMTSDGTAMTLFVTREAPHTLVKIAPAGQPVEFVLVARGRVREWVSGIGVRQVAAGRGRRVALASRTSDP